MDRLSEANMSAVLARLEASTLVPPDDLQGSAREMFVAIADNNRSRPWGTSHAFALADYCRVVVLWNEQMKLIGDEGAMVGGKPNPRFKVTPLLSAERLRLGKILGLHVGMRDKYLGGSGKNEENARRIGATMARSADSEDGELLA